MLRRDGVALSYELRGSGPLVVLVQGLGLSGRLWLGLPGGLVKDGFRVLVPDTRGSGLSDVSPPPYTMEMLAADVAALIRACGGQSALVVGISLGGMIAQHVALHYPELVGGMVLAATSCGVTYGRLSSPSALAQLIRAVLAPGRLGDLHTLLAHPASLAANPRLFERWDQMLSDPAARPARRAGLIGQLAAAAAHDTGARLSEIRCPVEVLTGDSDRIIPPVNSEILVARLPSARLTVVPKAGHAFPLEHPGVLPAAIRRLKPARLRT